MGDRSSSCNAAGRAVVLASALILIASFTAPAAAVAQTGTLAGRLTDEDGAPLGGANITLVEAKRGAISLQNGDYVVADVPVGTYTVQVRLIGYRPANQSVTLTAGER